MSGLSLSLRMSMP